MFRLAAFFGLVGLVAATGIIIWSGWAQVLQALAQAGWQGIFATALIHFCPLIISSVGWYLLVPGKNKRVRQFIYFMWLRASVNALMPVARIGGEIAAVRVMTAHGMRRNVAIASTVVELTLSVAAVFLFIVFGALLFTLRVNDKNLTVQLACGILFSLPLLAALVYVQKIGFFGVLSRLFRLMFRDKWAAVTGSAARLDRAVHTIYRRKNRVVACAILQLVAWVVGSAEIWVGLHFLGHPLPPLESAMIEALIQGSASAGFAIPGALGVQEAGFLLFGGMLGLSPQTAAALAVIRRCRDLICYVPGLVAWQTHEGKRLLRS